MRISLLCFSLLAVAQSRFLTPTNRHSVLVRRNSKLLTSLRHGGQTFPRPQSKPQYLPQSQLQPLTAAEQTYRTAVIRTTIAISAATAFGLTLAKTHGLQTSQEFFAGYLVEQSLSVDNLFVFIMLFDYFKVPVNLQTRVLNWGIGGAIAMRGVMIAVGVTAIQKFNSVILVFAAILLASSAKLLSEGIGVEESHGQGENGIMKLARWMFKSTSEFDGEKFFTVVETKTKMRKVATPLFVCLVCIELSDFVFAVDSIPAVIGVTKDPMVVYSSNIFAILALRSLYVIVAQAVSDLLFLRPAVALVLGFIGMKMILEFFHYEIGTGASLGVVTGLLGGGIGLSMLHNKHKERIKGTGKGKGKGKGNL